MKYTTLPNTDIKVSKICLGTMTFGEQVNEADSHAILDRSLARESASLTCSPKVMVPKQMGVTCKSLVPS